MGRDVLANRVIAIHRSFNPRAHVGRDSRRASCRSQSSSFNPRAHVGARRQSRNSGLSSISFQSTRPRVARHLCSYNGSAWVVFQSTRPRGGRDAKAAVTTNMNRQFQSTRPRGARRDARPAHALHGLVSIHAPTWGATSFSGRAAPPPCFNPRAHVGRDFVP